MRTWLVIALCAISGGCSNPRETAPANATPAAPESIAIAVVGPQRDLVSDVGFEPAADLDVLVERGHIRILIAPSRTHFRVTAAGAQGRAVDAAMAMMAVLSKRTGRPVSVEFVPAREESLVSDLVAGKADIAANILLTFARDEQVAFAPPIRSGIRELVVTRAGSRLVSLEDVGDRIIHVRQDSDHHASLIRLNRQLKSINRPQARIVTDGRAATDEELLERVNAGRIPATVVDDYIFEFWQKEFPKTTANRDVAVSQDGVVAWATRRDTPKLTAFVKEFFSTHRLTF